MIVCSCNVLSDHAIRRAAADCRSCPVRLSTVFEDLGCRPQCGRCAPTVKRIVRESGAAISDDAVDLAMRELVAAE